MLHTTTLAFTVASLLLLPSPALARTWHINPGGTGDAPTVQAGIDSSAAGDTVALACGQYRETLIELRSGIVLRAEPGPCRPLFFVGGPPTIVPGPYIRVEDADADTRIEGLEFYQNASTTPDRSSISVIDASPTIVDCVFRYCWAESQNPGIRLNNSSPLVEECRFEPDMCYGIQCENGSSPTILRTRFSHGSRSINLIGAGDVRVLECTFSHCDGGRRGGGIYAEDSASLLVRNCIFNDGHAGRGSGIYVLRMPSVEIKDCSFVNNHASQHGAALISVASSVNITSCTFDGNLAPLGGAIYSRSGSAITVYASTFTGHRIGPVVGCNSSPPPTMTCSNMFGNELGDWTGCLSGLGGAAGNFSADPLFCDPESGDHHLQWGSPCLPANSPDGCGLIGAYGFGGCNSVSVTPKSWARVKARYR